MRVNHVAQAVEWVTAREETTTSGCVIYQGGLPAWLVRLYFRCGDGPVLILTKRPTQWEWLFPRSGDNLVHPNVVFTVAEQLGATQQPDLTAAGVLIVDVSVLSDPMRLHQLGLPYCDTSVTYPPAPPLREAYASYRRRRLPDVLAFDSHAYCAVIFDVSRPLTVRELCFLHLFAAHAADAGGGDGAGEGGGGLEEVRRFVYCEDLPVRVLGLTAALVGCAIPPRPPHVEDALLDVQEADAVARANAFVREHVCVCEYGVQDAPRPTADEAAVAVVAAAAAAAAAAAGVTSLVAEIVAVALQEADAAVTAQKAAGHEQVPMEQCFTVEENEDGSKADSEEVAAAVSRSPSVAASSTLSSEPSPPTMPSGPPPQQTHPLFLPAARRTGPGPAGRLSWGSGRGGGGGDPSDAALPSVLARRYASLQTKDGGGDPGVAKRRRAEAAEMRIADAEAQPPAPTKKRLKRKAAAAAAAEAEAKRRRKASEAPPLFAAKKRKKRRKKNGPPAVSTFSRSK